MPSHQRSSSSARQRRPRSSAAASKSVGSACASSESATAFLSRPTSAAWGKCTATIKTMVPDEFREDCTRFWRDKGYQSESDFVREALMVTVYGPEYLADLHRERIESLVRGGTGIGTKRRGTA